ncbi:MAG: cell division protein FtsQ/DivIB [Candidatus Omnitrophica bacterium]|nr:cell division protein FtsQ/DivIB [Candidatus Omnitrophota bacterium]
MKKQKFNFPTRAVIIIAIIFLAILLAIGYIWRILQSSGYFRIKDVIIRGQETPDLSYLKGRNIFSVDLERESRFILNNCPACDKIRLVRVLPDRIFVDFLRRRALALVKFYRNFAVDEQGVLFNAPEDIQGLNLPVISGLERKIFGPKPGTRYNIKELTLALNLIKEIGRDSLLKHYYISKIDVADPASAALFISFPGTAAQGRRIIPLNLEVKFGQDNIRDKVAILAGMISHERPELYNIKYIDLRFKEPVIKLKDAQ